MIERNLGNVERILRLLFGIFLFVWALQQAHMNAVEWFVMVTAVALVLNGLFSRCYLWYVLDINSCGEGNSDCHPNTCP